MIKNLRSYILNIIFPPVCGMCGKFNKDFLCKKCELLLKNESNFEIDRLDFLNGLFFSNHIYFFKYQGMIRKLILEYKFNEKSYLYKTFVNFILKDKKFFEILNSYDTIVSVPISYIRKKERGYNQSKLIAKELSNIVGIKYIEVLRKTIDTVPQSTLNKKERLENLKNVYKIKDKISIRNKKILMVDDIYTTGTTVTECCKIMIENGARQIDILTIAKD